MTSFFLGTNQDTSIVPLTKFMLRPCLAFIKCSGLVRNRDEIRFANPALISGRQMSVHASITAIFLVAITKKDLYPSFREI